MVVLVDTWLLMEDRITEVQYTESWCHVKLPWLRASGQLFRMWRVVGSLDPHNV